jgi:tRNA threonylcarbamoyladenosine biosynthesis protein TsaE
MTTGVIRRTVDLPNLTATEKFGQRLGRLLFPGAVVALIGPLGAGKTHLVRAIAEELGVDPRAVSSPTFVLIQEYEGRLPVYHFDAYRLAGGVAFADLGVEEYFEGEGVCLVEWADRVEKWLPGERLSITLRMIDETTRQAEILASGQRYDELIGALT